MKSFDPSQYGAPGEVLDIDPPQWRRPNIVLPDRHEDQWQPLGAVVRRVMARLMVEQDGQP